MRKQQGIALVAALAVMAVVAALVFGTVFTTRVEQVIAHNDSTSTQAFQVAQAGLQKYKTAAFQTFQFYLANLNRYGGVLSRYATCGNLLEAGLDLDRDFDVDGNDLSPVRAVTETVNTGAGSGTYTVSYGTSGSSIVITSLGRFANARSTVRAVIQAKNAGLFSNAIFVGGGTSGHINGGAEVWGSVTIDGNDPSATVISSNGGFSLNNYYRQEDLEALTGVSNATLRDFLKAQALHQPDMCARIRVNQGRIAVGGSTTIGDASAPSSADNPGVTYEPKVAGVNVQNGTPDVSVSGSAVIHGPVGPYDLDPPLRFPVLDTGPSGEKYCKRDATKTWRQCMQDDALASGMVVTYQGAGVTPTTQPALSGCNLSAASVLSGRTITFGTSNITCLRLSPAAGFSYTYNASTRTGELVVEGIVDFRGFDLKFAQNVVVRYSEKATLLVESQPGGGGNVTVDGDVLPGGLRPDGTRRTFPDADVLGIVADNALTFTGANQNRLSVSQQIAMGLFYSGGLTTVAQGGMVMGNVTARTFSSSSSGNGGQRAKVMQVPGLEYNLSPGFDQVRQDTVASFFIRSYERR